MTRDEFYEIGLASGWLDKAEMCGGVSVVDREVAVKAIAARANGTPAEAASQILSGIAALDSGPEKPVVVRWPEGFDEEDYLIKRSEWHAQESNRLMTRHHYFVDMFKHRTSAANPSSQSEQTSGAGLSPASGETHGDTSRGDEQARKSWHQAMVKNGVYQSESLATSDRNPRDRK